MTLGGFHFVAFRYMNMTLGGFEKYEYYYWGKNNLEPLRYIAFLRYVIF